MSRVAFASFIFFYTIALYYLATTLPIGPNEAMLYYTDDRVLGVLIHLFDDTFLTTLDFRLPFLLFSFLNIYLFYKVSKIYFKKRETAYLVTTFFALLPGIITASVIVNIAVVVIALVLSFIILHEKKQRVWQGVVMLLLLFIHDASLIFFIPVAIFFAIKRDHELFALSIILSLFSLFYFNGLEIGGRPEGRFLELFGLYIALFSPLVFLYFFYALYRIWLREEKDILWYISFTAFIFSVLLSLRQQVIMTDFAPYVIVSVVLMVLTYQKTIDVRLPQFQVAYRLGYRIVLVSMLLFSSVIVFHKSFFYLIDDKSKHFAYPFYEPYWQVKELHKIEKNCYTVSHKKVQYQLKYYGIESCKELDVPKIHI
jgi:hypothetical protein